MLPFLLGPCGLGMIQVPYEDWQQEDFRIVENALRVLASQKPINVSR